jgi:hypothetical protein
MFSGTFLKKYLVRVVKIVTLVFLCHQVLNAKLLGSSSKSLQWFYTINNLLCISTGKEWFTQEPSIHTCCTQVWWEETNETGYTSTTSS